MVDMNFGNFIFRTTISDVTLQTHNISNMAAHPALQLKVGAQIDMYRLDLRIRLESVLAQLSTNAGLLVAAEGNPEMGVLRAVDLSWESV